MQFSRKLLIAGYRFPTVLSAPSDYSTQLLAQVESANYTTYSVTSDGWYLVEVLGGGGGASSEVRRPSSGGCASKLVYLYQGMTCLLWGGAGPGSKGVAGACGYPGTQDSTFGGRGAVGHDESGGSGGGGSYVGHNGNTNHYTGGSGGGSGFIAGFTDITSAPQSVTLGSMTLNINRTLVVGSVVTFSCISSYVIGAGGGGCANDNGSDRASGGGGGAFGDGGTTYYPNYAAQTGPAGAWGKGEDGGHYGGGTRGAWAVVDFSTNTFDWGLGGGTAGAAGYCKLYKVIPN